VNPEPHTLAADEVARGLGVRPEEGLAADEVIERQRRLGPNRLPEERQRPLWLRFVDQLRDFMILVLLAAAVVSGLVGDLVDTVVIAAIVLVNAGIGLWQQWRADRAMQLLRRMSAGQATVRRAGGMVSQVATDQLVPGDVVLIEAGNLVPADLRLHGVAQLRVDESALTGESVGVDKHPEPLAQAGLPLADRHNMAWKGTLVTQGRGVGLVVATGARTELGRIAGLLAAVPARLTPLQQRLAVFGKRLSLLVLAICAVVFGAGLLRGEPLLPMAMTAISLAVAAIPEALPAVVTVLLALGAARLVRMQALVRRLAAVETLGSVTVICSDKTGTLTANRMQVQRHAGGDALWPALALCNDAAPAAGGGWVGEPTETALLDACQGAGADVEALRRASPRRHEWPFDAVRKRMSTLHPGPTGSGWRLVVKGAPETVLPRCRPSPRRDEFEALAREWAAGGLRVLAVALHDGDAVPSRHGDDTAPSSQVDDAAPPLGGDDGALTSLAADEIERELDAVGVVALIDPPRRDAQAAVAECRSAGIRPVMITGDHPATALAIARQLGIADGDDHTVITGAELARLDDDAFAALCTQVSVYARMDPAQKIRIVKALQSRGEFVAMTGDGVNDSPALRQADIGVAMGASGTDVAREASSLVLLDDRFASIVGAVREGRRIYDNVRKFVRYVLTGNSGEIWLLFLAPLVGLPIPLLPIHILWVNLVTDGLPGLALVAEPADAGVMRRPPRPPRESLFAHGLWQHALMVGLLIGGLCLGLQAHTIATTPAAAQTMVFTLLTLAQMAHVLAIRSERESLFTQGLGSNLPLLGAVVLTVALQLAVVYVPWLRPLFHTVALDAAQLGLCFVLASVVFVVVELEKAWRRR